MKCGAPPLPPSFFFPFLVSPPTDARAQILTTLLTRTPSPLANPEWATVPYARHPPTALDALLENAIGHTEAGDQIEVSARRENGQAVLAVADSGCGIEPHDLQRIFQRFARASTHRNREAGGFGLGLAIVKHICANHGGEVTVWSEEGRGSTFTMRLPAAPSSGPPSPLPAAAAAPPVPHRGPVDVREVTR